MKKDDILKACCLDFIYIRDHFGKSKGLNKAAKERFL